MAPPICTAVPSRPAEPPKRWVINVPKALKAPFLAELFFEGFRIILIIDYCLLPLLAQNSNSPIL